MSAQQFEQVARNADQLARAVEQVDTTLRRIGEAAVNVIGGTATGTDKAMLGLTAQAATKARAAMSNLTEAARAARHAAEAERDRERRESEQGR